MSAAIARNIANILYSMSGTTWSLGDFVASHTAANALPLGSVSGSLGWATLFNADANNAVQMYNNNSDLTHPILQIPPQGFNVVTFYTACVPYFLAITADVKVEFMLLAQ